MNGFLETLKASGVERLIDVRENAMSRRAEFSSRRLAASLEERGIGYVHIPSLGSPRKVRAALREDGNVARFVADYESHLAKESAQLNRLAELAAEKSSVIMCYERDASDCHRRIIAERLGGMGFAICDLQ